MNSPDTPTATAPAPLEKSADTVTRPPQQLFWESLQSMCGQKYSGQLTVGTEESDRKFGYADLVIDARRCTSDAIDIGLSVDDDHSRTWMIRRHDDGLSLHHRHLGPDGKEDATSGYGGYTAEQGAPGLQQFPADENTGQMIPAAATNVWSIEIKPNESFTYQLLREEEQRQFRIVFDLSTPLDSS
ncbi:MAG: hypothetical protein HKN70_12305 [Gammaproteobacteria bacterium]|nr:hypothetical protein [Gammaproteobacteria bacterium]